MKWFIVSRSLLMLATLALVGVVYETASQLNDLPLPYSPREMLLIGGVAILLAIAGVWAGRSREVKPIRGHASDLMLFSLTVVPLMVNLSVADTTEWEIVSDLELGNWSISGPILHGWGMTITLLVIVIVFVVNTVLDIRRYRKQTEVAPSVTSGA